MFAKREIGFGEEEEEERTGGNGAKKMERIYNEFLLRWKRKRLPRLRLEKKKRCFV